MFAHCPADRLCDACVESWLAQLRGVAARRGEAWAESVALRVTERRPWPRDERAFAIARRKVSDLARDARLLDQLADEALAWAARWWERR